MNRIYRDAARVLVWLGLHMNKEAVQAFRFVHELDAALTSHTMNGKSRDIDIIGLERYISENQKALQALADRPWFKRGWVVQEIGTSTPATMIWGDATIDWEILANMCEKLKGYHHLRSRLGIATSDVSFLFRRFVEPDKKTHYANRFNFVYELQRARHLQFSDDRDRVFAFLGHFSTRSLQSFGCGPVSIMADYTKTVERTYIDVAIQILRANPAAAPSC
ncbi:putative het domain-containing protein [Rosellinia necatrix]|uniref:Putative het domain-containing protein n=1 Tax=Rosellinia necatrix TaxID=77044 RepID=A0A1S8A7D8_ROSNE|nr:putative het domain-containing protein [Rosellinia necatrix]